MKITYLNKRGGEKRFRGGDLGSKIDSKSSLFDGWRRRN